MKTDLSSHDRQMRYWRILPVVALGALILQSIQMEGYCSDYLVTTDADSGAGSLREAINAANTNIGDDFITFGDTLLDATITLLSELIITDDLTITGPGSEALTLSGGGTNRIIFNENARLTINNIRLFNGNNISGGGVLNEAFGGGIAEVVISESILDGNRAKGFGGGAILNLANSGGSATAHIIRCKIHGNLVSGSGGGILNYATGRNSYAITTISQTTICDNRSDLGGGVASHSFALGSTQLLVDGTTVNNNTADYYGGGFSVSGVAGSSVLEIINSTLSGNVNHGIYVEGIDDRPGPGYGGVDMQSCTLAGNIGGGILGIEEFGTIEVRSYLTLWANTNGLNYTSRSGKVLSDGYNISDDGTPSTNNPTDLGKVFDLGDYLAPLADNGGATQTHALLSGSPAIDAGDPLFDDSSVPFDQRGEGYNRISGDLIDIGAFEDQIKTPMEQLEDLAGIVEALDINAGVGVALNAKLDGAIAMIELGRESVACNQLDAFINQVNAQAGKTIESADAIALIAAAEAIKIDLGCP